MRSRLRSAECLIACGILLPNTPESWLIGVSSTVRVCAISAIEITKYFSNGLQTRLQSMFHIITSSMLGLSVAEAAVFDWWSQTQLPRKRVQGSFYFLVSRQQVTVTSIHLTAPCRGRLDTEPLEGFKRQERSVSTANTLSFFDMSPQYANVHQSGRMFGHPCSSCILRSLHSTLTRCCSI